MIFFRSLRQRVPVFVELIVPARNSLLNHSVGVLVIKYSCAHINVFIVFKFKMCLFFQTTPCRCSARCIPTCSYCYLLLFFAVGVGISVSFLKVPIFWPEKDGIVMQQLWSRCMHGVRILGFRVRERLLKKCQTFIKEFKSSCLRPRPKIHHF